MDHCRTHGGHTTRLDICIKITILNTKFIICYAKFIIFNAKFIDFITNRYHDLRVVPEYIPTPGTTCQSN